MLPYPYTDLHVSRHRDYEQRAKAHRFITALARSGQRQAK